VHSFIQKFPAEMKPAFVSKGILSPKEVLKIIRCKPSNDTLTVDETRVFRFLEKFIKQCTDKGKSEHGLIIQRVLNTFPRHVRSVTTQPFSPGHPDKTTFGVKFCSFCC
jgi:hypothetical protein